MTRLSHSHDRFKTVFKRLDGLKFYGQVLEIPDTARVSNFLTPRRYLRTSIKSVIAPRDVVIIGDKKYIVAEHGDGFFTEEIYKHFKLFEVDKEATWMVNTTVTNAVTGVKTVSRAPSLEKAYLSTQPKSDLQGELKIPLQSFVCISDKILVKDQLVDGKVVTRVDTVLGVTLVEIREV